MQKDERDLLEVLKSELEFLESHGYRRSPETAWRPKYIFEDSPTCTNYHFAENPRPCTECTLIHLVPPTLRSAKSPCRHIPLNESGDTLDSLYRYGTQRQIDDVMRTWLRAAITRLEEERKAVKAPENRSWLRGTPLYTKQHPKCANPACSTAFHWTAGGKYFRFRPDDHSAAGVHGVRHYWLCERCSHVFTAVYGAPCGVVIKLLWPEIVAEPPEKASAA